MSVETQATESLDSANEPQLEHDSSTNALIRRYRRLKGAREKL